MEEPLSTVDVHVDHDAETSRRRHEAGIWSNASRLILPIVAAVGLTLVAGPTAADAQSWPSKPIKFIVGYPPGGGADIQARLFAEPMSRALGQPIIVENRPGAGGTVAANSVVQAEGDGHTLYVAAISEISIAPATVKSLPYDPDKNLAPVVMFGKWPQILVASPSFEPSTLSELTAYVKANPGKVSYSSFGNNTLNHINGERFKAVLDLDVLHVPYRGSGPSLTAIMGGHVQYTFDSPSTTLGLIKSGKLKAIAVAGPERLAGAPEIPTTAEAGLPNFYVSSWIGLLAPAGTPAAIIDRLNKEALAALKLPEMQEALKKNNTEPGGGTPQEFGQRIRAEIADYRQIAAKVGIVPQ
jgi:tripartite-type tricarboxylate transporter receptor subunit TctC